ncbi:uncharacterized protein LOC120354479 isoform X2 [Nilaparvata lugens]|uniref:uncharacterized protein LOC120354479 isoform X2 n=1 Tax=Nilaparvata lugens TaxID=108931 RepID=UPI00193D3856|nr:uncharacterized protein LOC120354479 isoform X2 [Nilaparvata lugens]
MSTAFSCSSIIHIIMDMNIVLRIMIMMVYYGYYGYHYMSQLLDFIVRNSIPESVLNNTSALVVYLLRILKAVCYWFALTRCFFVLTDEYIKENINLNPEPEIREVHYPTMLGD